MMRALWTAASGMISQQMNVDTISNNLSNVNTTGYKKERVEFKSLLYETLRAPSMTESGQGRPVGLQVGHGVMPAAISKDFSTGNIERTDGAMDFALEGNGFFAVRTPNNEVYYTKDGTFKVALFEDQLRVTTTDGYYVLNSEGEPLALPSGIGLDKFKVDAAGKFAYTDNTGNTVDVGQQIRIVQFRNVYGLNYYGNNNYTPSSSSGQPINETEDDTLTKTNVQQGTLERANVQVVQEMVNLIVAQRAYEVSSKAIQTADDMLSQANNLKR